MICCVTLNDHRDAEDSHMGFLYWFPPRSSESVKLVEPENDQDFETKLYNRSMLCLMVRRLPTMRPDASASPFLEIPETECLCSNALAFAIYDRFPVSPGHVLVITRRVVPTFFECTAAEQLALLSLVGGMKALLDQRLDSKPDGYNVGFNAGVAAGKTVPHVHVHVMPRYAGDTGDPRGGVRHVIPGRGRDIRVRFAENGLGDRTRRRFRHHDV